MIENILSPVAFEIWKMLDRLEEWIWNRHSLSSGGKPYTIVHPETRIALWVCSGRWFLDGYNDSVFSYDEKGMVKELLFKTRVPDIGLIDRHFLWHKVKKVMRFLERKDDEPSLANELKEYNESREI